MEEPENILQRKLFQNIKLKLKSHEALVEVIEDLLSLSTDSAYRRIRGRKELTLTELQILCSHFNISADELLNSDNSEQIIFNYRALHPTHFNLRDYLQTNLDNLRMMTALSSDCKLFYCAMSLPLFDYFHIKEIAAFKLFVWQKSIAAFPDFVNKTFSFAQADKELNKIGERFLSLYQEIPSIELWNVETCNSLFSQIKFYAETNLFENPEEAFLLLDKVEEYLNHVMKQAEYGLKFPIGSMPHSKSGSYELYLNEVVIADNTIMVTAGEKRFVFLTHAALNFLNTSNDSFCNTTHEWLSNLIKRSSLLSSSSEKQRVKFFNGMFAKVNQLREQLKYILTEQKNVN